jgi:pimeloyl-ACP methyl ester carboxylesterase
VKFAATDGVELSGLVYEPKRATKRAAVFLHGNGGASIFDSNRTNRLAEVFLRHGIAYAPFNNRGAHLIRRLRATSGTRRRSVDGGMAFELIRDCVHDIDGAARMLRERGFTELFLLGHSTGANKIAVYDHYRPRNPFRRYVLLGGADDAGLTRMYAGERRFEQALVKARAMIKAKRGAELVPRTLSPMPLSWRSFLDTNNPDGDYNVFPFLEVMRGRISRKPLFRHLAGIRKPSLYLYGDSDEYLFDDVSGCVAILAEAIGGKPNVEIAVLEDADHGFGGREEELGTLIAEWFDS